MIGETDGKHPRFWTAEDWVDDIRSHGGGSFVEVLADDIVRVYNPEGGWSLCAVGTRPPQLDSEVVNLRHGDMSDLIMSHTVITGEIEE